MRRRSRATTLDEANPLRSAASRPGWGRCSAVCCSLVCLHRRWPPRRGREPARASPLARSPLAARALSSRRSRALLSPLTLCGSCVEPRPQLKYVLSAAKPVRTTEGASLFKQRDVLTGGCMYVVASGRYRATVQHGGRGGASRTREYGPQDSFGASDLLCHDTGGERSCSVAVLRGGLVWAIPQRVVDLKLRIAPPSPISGLLDFCASCKLFATLSPERLVQLGSADLDGTQARGST